MQQTNELKTNTKQIHKNHTLTKHIHKA